jgi:hypothetical protein
VLADNDILTALKVEPTLECVNTTNLSNDGVYRAHPVGGVTDSHNASEPTPGTKLDDSFVNAFKLILATALFTPVLDNVSPE